MPRLPNIGALMIVCFVICLTSAAQAPGHVNPEPDEYYAIHCLNDAVEVYRTVPERELLGSTAFRVFVPMPEGSTLQIGPGVTLTRVDREYFTVSGSNGNRAPDPGEKTFTFTACLLTNSGMPVPAPTVARTPVANPTPQPTEIPYPGNPRAGVSWLTVIMYLCWGNGPIGFGLVFVPGLLRWWHVRRKRGG